MRRYIQFILAFVLALNVSVVFAENDSTETTQAEKTESKSKTPDPFKVKVEVTQAQKDNVREILREFISSIGKDISQYNIQVVESKQLNAFATVGRKIVVNSSLINFLESESALAFVMAHELGHIESKHVYKSVIRTGLGALFRFALFRKRPESKYKDIYDGANQFHNLHYSRSKETEADHFAVELINKFYCHVPNKLEFFEKLSKASNGKKPSKITEYFSTHPLPSSRIRYLRTEIEAAGCDF